MMIESKIKKFCVDLKLKFVMPNTVTDIPKVMPSVLIPVLINCKNSHSPLAFPPLHPFIVRTRHLIPTKIKPAASPL